jgi:hypothetical protein
MGVSGAALWATSDALSRSNTGKWPPPLEALGPRMISDHFPTTTKWFRRVGDEFRYGYHLLRRSPPDRSGSGPWWNRAGFEVDDMLEHRAVIFSLILITISTPVWTAVTVVRDVGRLIRQSIASSLRRLFHE